jgi:hypothetical protein
MSKLLPFITPREWKCHRCGSPLKGSVAARYCSYCLWDELADPTRTRFDATGKVIHHGHRVIKQKGKAS